MAKVYAVFAEAVYRHECAGIFASRDAAIELAKERFAASDHHHQYAVYEYALNDPLPFVAMSRRDSGIVEPDPIFKIDSTGTTPPDAGESGAMSESASACFPTLERLTGPEGFAMQPGEHLDLHLPFRARITNSVSGAELAKLHVVVSGIDPHAIHSAVSEAGSGCWLTVTHELDWHPLPVILNPGWVRVRTSVPNQIRFEPV